MKSTERQNNETDIGGTAIPTTPDQDGPMSDNCDGCFYAAIEECDATFHIPPCMLDEAGIDSDRGIVFTVGQGEIIISEMEDEDGDGYE